MTTIPDSLPMVAERLQLALQRCTDALQAIDKLTCNCPCMSLQAQHEFERCSEAEAYKIELAKVILAIREQARSALKI